jgi:metal-responsive CopG/Arc/MetJ family transcriptional regulator
MASITIELTGPTADKLRQLAQKECRSESEIVRDAVEAYVPGRRRLPTGAGKYHSGQPDLAQKDEEILRKDAEAGLWP